jgi:HK97 family phage prohead protease
MKYAQLIKDLKAKNVDDQKIKDAILEKSKTEIQHFNFGFKSFKVKEATGDEKKSIEIEGYASTKDVDRYGDIVNPSAFEETIDLFMTNPVMLLQHDHNKRIGDFTDLTIDDKGLYVKGDVKFTAGDPELFEKIESGSLKGFSIGFKVLEAEWQEITDEKGNIVDYVFIINKLDLVEISVCNVPANPFTLMKSLENLATKSFEAVVKDLDEEEDDEEGGEDEDDTPNDGGDNDNNNDDPNENGNENNEEEKSTEGDDEEEKDTPAEGADDEEEEAEDAEDEPADDGEEEEKELDEDEEKDNIEDEDEDPENQPETEDAEEAGKDSKAFTTKMIEKIVDSKTAGNKKETKALLEKGVKALEKDFEKKLEAVKSDFEKELDAIVETVKSIKETEQEIIDRLKSTVKGKGFLNIKTTSEKKTASNRLEKILTGVKNNNFKS